MPLTGASQVPLAEMAQGSSAPESPASATITMAATGRSVMRSSMVSGKCRTIDTRDTQGFCSSRLVMPSASRRKSVLSAGTAAIWVSACSLKWVLPVTSTVRT